MNPVNPVKPLTGADLFCGAGGTTSGLLRACAALNRPIDLLAINHWNIAIDTHTKNHPGVRHLCESLDNVDPRKLIPRGRLDILCASPECTHHSIARGGRPCADQSRATAWHILRWAEALRIENILIENVREFKNWGPLTKAGRPMKRKKGQTFQAFLHALRSLNYQVDYRVLNAADYGDPTTRQRLFIIPEPTHAGRWQPARGIIDWSLKGQSIYTRKKPLSPNTLRRIEAGLKKFGGQAFVLHTTHSGGPNRCSSIENPVPTITTANRGEMALAEPFIVNLRGTQPRQIDDSARSLEEPLLSLTTSGAHVALCEPFLVNYHNSHEGRTDGNERVLSLGNPIPALDCSNRLGLVEPFLVKYYGNGEGAHPVTEPLATVTANDRFGLVEPEQTLDIRFRMLQPHELAAAMSFPSDYTFTGTRESQVRQIGNAVPVLTAAALCAQLLT